MTHRIHGRGYYAQTDSLQGELYAQADFCLSASASSVRRMTIEEKIRAIIKATGWKQQRLAEYFEVSQSTVNRWLAGAEPEGHRRDAINVAFDSLVDESPASREPTETIPIMGFLGAGAEVEPEFEQVPPEGLDQVSIPFPLPDEMIAFKVKGISMLPVFKDGTIIIVYREQKKPLESFYGEEAAVRTSDGRRFIKTIMRGTGGVNLISWNAAPIEDVYLDWIGEIFAVLPPSILRKSDRAGRMPPSQQEIA